MIATGRYCLLGLLVLIVFEPTDQNLRPSDEDTKPAFQPLPIKVPVGFVIELAAAPPLVRYAMMACFAAVGPTRSLRC